ncbi:MAG: putative maltokinase, partial [Candidatus Eisenbacteria bacterium]|nr:putative maltokinase [Candidatus Eisenbacteria bacterium]
SAGAGTAAGIGTSMGTGAGGGAGPGSSRSSFFVLVRVDYTEGDSENYFLTLGYVTGEEAQKVRASSPPLVLARLTANGREGLLIESMAEESFCESLLRAIERRRRFGREAEVLGRPTASFRALRGDPAEPLPVKVTGGEQSNTSMVYGDRFILKLFRKIDEGVNPDLEIGRHLSEKVRYPNTPLVAGSIEYRRPDAAEPMTLAILQQFVPNEGDAWRYTLSSLADYFDRVQAARHDLMRPDLRQASVVDLARADPDPKSFDLIGPYLSMVQLLAERTAQLHIALAADARDPNFAPEPFGALYQRSLYQSMRTLTVRSMELLRRRLASLPDAIRGEGEEILRAQPKIEQKFQRLLQGKISGRRIRVHGDYHLGQVLFTGKDFLIIDFEGEPAHSLGERRIKRSALRDVAGMLRSFHYAAYTALATEAEPGGVAHSADGVEPIEPWARWWYMWVSAAFLRRYLERTAGSGLLPSTDEELKILFDCYLMEKAVYELAYELNNRPDWVRIPIQGIQQVLTEVA